MTNPLTKFDWTTLYDRYDSACKRFDPNSLHLKRFGSDRPASDRLLYHRLIGGFQPYAIPTDYDPAGTYEAMLYWKYYSQGTCSRNIGELTTAGSKKRQATATDLVRLFAALPATLVRNIATVVSLVRSISDYVLPCTNGCALPTRTTLLHFLYPDVVPIFDKQVLKAVGEDGKGNHSYEVFKRYLPFAWELADRYGEKAGQGHTESALRLVDMALWISRGKK